MDKPGHIWWCLTPPNSNSVTSSMYKAQDPELGSSGSGSSITSWVLPSETHFVSEAQTSSTLCLSLSLGLFTLAKTASSPTTSPDLFLNSDSATWYMAF